MPLYNQLLPIPFLAFGYPMNTFLVFKAEAVLADTFSQQVYIPMGKQGGAKGLRIELDFNANPGNFEFDVMENSTPDFTGTGQRGYQQVVTSGQLTQAGLTTGKNGALTKISTDLNPFFGEFFCLYVKTAPTNANITVTARVTRAA